MNADEPNPYQPPAARVADVEPNASAPVSMPTIVLWGVSLLYLGLALGVVRGLPAFARLMDMAVSPVVLILGGAGAIAIFAAYVFLIYKIGRGRRWARMTYAALYLLAAIALIAQYAGFVESSAEFSVVALVRHLLPAVGLALLFAPASNAWFRRTDV